MGRLNIAVGMMFLVMALAGCFGGDSSMGGPPAQDEFPGAGALPEPFTETGSVSGVGEFVVVLCGQTADCPRYDFVLESPATLMANLTWSDAGASITLDLMQGQVVGPRVFQNGGTALASMRQALGPGEYGLRLVPQAPQAVDYVLEVSFAPPVMTPDGPVRGLTASGAQDTQEHGDGSLWFTFEHVQGNDLTYTVPTDEFTAAVALEVDLDGAGIREGIADAISFALRDENGLQQCYFHLFLKPYSCSAPDAGADRGDWTVVLPAEADDFAPFTFRVGLLNQSAVQNIEALGYINPDIAFRLQATGYAAGEASIGLLPDGAIMLQQGIFSPNPAVTVRSRDGGVTWDDVTPPAWGHGQSQDPLLRVDPYGGHVWVSHLYSACSYLARSDDGGTTWTENPVACGAPVNDHQKVASGPHPIGLGEPAVYYASSSRGDIGTLQVSRSWDGGMTWTPAGAYSESSHADAVSGEAVRNLGNIVADRTGHVYTASYRCPEGIIVGSSADVGATFAFGQVADDPTSCADHDLGLAVDAADNVYVAYESEQRVRLIVSQDHGATWSEPLTVSPPELGSVVNVAMTAGDDGRIAIAYRGTPDGDQGPNRVPGDAAWQVYVAFVLNTTTTTPEIHTALASPPDDPVQRGTICTYGGACRGDRNLLDFIGVATGPDGRVHVAYGDGCMGYCPSPSDSRANIGIVAIQETGPLLYEGGAPWAE